MEAQLQNTQLSPKKMKKKNKNQWIQVPSIRCRVQSSSHPDISRGHQSKDPYHFITKL
uniref:Uncharacterized protein n=1 Tax=Rhizophora mucronata TaxID=61149 RepID=A0A2P2K7H2_RHIMU